MELHIKTREMLKKLGVTPDFRGYAYLIDIIEIAKEQMRKDGTFRNIFNAYGEIAKKYNTTDRAVERCIRYTVKVSMDNPTEKMLELFPARMKNPTNSSFISTIAEQLIIEEESNG